MMLACAAVCGEAVLRSTRYWNSAAMAAMRARQLSPSRFALANSREAALLSARNNGNVADAGRRARFPGANGYRLMRADAGPGCAPRIPTGRVAIVSTIR